MVLAPLRSGALAGRCGGRLSCRRLADSSGPRAASFGFRWVSEELKQSLGMRPRQMCLPA